jgi:hypothetical protein
VLVAAKIRIVQMYDQAMPLRQTMTGPRLSTNLQSQMPGCGGSFFHMLLVCSRCFFIYRVYIKFYHTAWQHRGSLASPRLSTKPSWQAAGLWREWFSCGCSMLFRAFFLNHGVGFFITQPGSSQGPLQPPGSPQNRPGRLPGCGGNGFHVVRCFS